MYYLVDPTKKSPKGENSVFAYKTVEEVVSHLETISPNIVGKTRSELMADASDLGFGVDDPEGKTFVSFMAEYINMGVIRKDGAPIRCDIFTENQFRGKSEYGD